MRKPIQISIPEPCSQPWDEMTTCGQGRFCGHCQKTVIDFSTWGDIALHEFFSKRTEKVCGRFLPSQLKRNIHIPPQPHSRLYRLTIALGLTLVFAQGASVYAQNKPPLTTQTATTLKPTNNCGVIKGKVTDKNKIPIVSAEVTLWQNEKQGIITITDEFGNYNFNSIKPGHYSLFVTYQWHIQTIAKNIKIVPQKTVEVNAIFDQLTSTLEILSYKKHAISNEPPTKTTANEINTYILGGPDVHDLTNLAPNLYQFQRGKGISANIGTPQPVAVPDIKQPKKDNSIKLDKDNPTKTIIKGEEMNRTPNR